MALTVAVGLAAPAHADSVSDKQREAQQIADRIDQLGNRAADLGEALNGAKLALDQAEADVQEAQTKLDQLTQKMGSLRSSMSAFALKAYVYADQTGGLAGLLAGTSTTEGAAQRQGYEQVALGANMDMTDDVKAVIEDTQNEQNILSARQDKAANLEKAYADAQQQANDALAQQQQLQSKVSGELAVLVAQQQQQQAQASVSAAAAAANNATQNNGQDTSSNGSQSSSGGSGPRPQNVVSPRTRSAPPPVNVPPTSPGAMVAVRAALSQVGVGYRFAAAEPGVAFDCSGLTMWAWAQAGVSLPHYSKAQYEVLPHVPLSAIRSGDLVFFYSDIHHVGIYIGNGAMVDAANPALGVRIAGIGGAIGAARP
jgi:cell wall-associated NlpC family hydrolase